MRISKSLKIPASLCIRCRGTKMLCGLSYCPITVKNLVEPKLKQIKGNELTGSSPPSVFVGRFGYPKVRLYPSSPPVIGDTSDYEDPGRWINIAMDEFLSKRLSLLRGGMIAEVHGASDPTRTLQDVQLMSMSREPTTVNMQFSKSLSSDRSVLDDHVTPMGPWSPLKKLEIEPGKHELVVEKVWGDADFKAQNAMFELYKSGIKEYRISKILSVGAIGVSKKRKMVPTRWSITATDKSLSDQVVADIKGYSTVDEHLVYVRKTSGNLFMAILSPRSWMFEWGESWFPGSTWNQWGSAAQVEIDHEGYYGRKDYPGIGGCYYASRLAVAEALATMKRQATATLWREIYPGFNLPVGVWFVRENMRAMFATKPYRFSSFQDAVDFLSKYTKVPVKYWLAKSGNYPFLRTGGLDDYL